MLSAGDILSLQGYRVLLHAPRLFHIRIFTIILGNFFPHFYIAYCNHCIFKCQVQELKKVFFKKIFFQFDDVSSVPSQEPDRSFVFRSSLFSLRIRRLTLTSSNSGCKK